MLVQGARCLRRCACACTAAVELRAGGGWPCRRPARCGCRWFGGGQGRARAGDDARRAVRGSWQRLAGVPCRGGRSLRPERCAPCGLCPRLRASEALQPRSSDDSGGPAALRVALRVAVAIPLRSLRSSGHVFRLGQREVRRFPFPFPFLEEERAFAFEARQAEPVGQRRWPPRARAADRRAAGRDGCVRRPHALAPWLLLPVLSAGGADGRPRLHSGRDACLAADVRRHRRPCFSEPPSAPLRPAEPGRKV
mmetsp:Transcript_71664/g.181011  ORF Transcript_71664/g.181011 Transcript_71664/m.181011 type:complete len:252 (+) Transcript_71664:225-980(+)